MRSRTFLSPMPSAPGGPIQRHRVAAPQQNALIDEPYRDAHLHRTLMARHAVHHGVLDQGLQYQTRHPHGGYFRRIRQLDLEAIGEAPLLQLEVELCKM